MRWTAGVVLAVFLFTGGGVAFADGTCVMNVSYDNQYACVDHPENCKANVSITLCKEAERQENENPDSFDIKWSLKDGTKMELDDSETTATVTLAKTVKEKGDYADTVTADIYFDEDKLHTSLSEGVEFGLLFLEIVGLVTGEGEEYTGDIKICGGLPVHVLCLTEESHTSGTVEWSSGDLKGRSDGEKYFIYPKKSKEDTYTVSVWDAECKECMDSITVAVDTWHHTYEWTSPDEDEDGSIELTPEITADDILSKLDFGSLTNDTPSVADEDDIRQAAEIAFEKKESSIKKAFAASLGVGLPLVGEAIKQWNVYKSNIIEQLANKVIKKAKNLCKRWVNEAKKDVKIFAKRAASWCNDHFKKRATALAFYKYKCDSFNPGHPGWHAIEVTTGNDHTDYKGKIGFDGISVSVEPFGVGISVDLKAVASIKLTIGPYTIDNDVYPVEDASDPTTTASYWPRFHYSIGGGIQQQSLLVLEGSLEEKVSKRLSKHALDLIAEDENKPKVKPLQ